ncbi:hypothetical protein N7539_002450 [Penicillium diatomitis]|uniref:SH3 domain-containing protein n=1 Tax=Penicillium diatomitis TaxID=2819901 RepID=A0A9W9XFN1_9EURO|nr:uncharacterized protein N7539_002450 [Penicillium diatomitis]KAJ5490883.1 hypothetical protein N7539_002450 [Penicillium diatomitis]
MVHGHALYHMEHRPLEARAPHDTIANDDSNLVERDNPLVIIYKTLSADFEGAIGGYVTKVMGANNAPVTTAIAIATATAATVAPHSKDTNNVAVGVGPAVAVTKITAEPTHQTAVMTTKEVKSQPTTIIENTQIQQTTVAEPTQAITSQAEVVSQAPSSFITSVSQASTSAAETSQDMNLVAATPSTTVSGIGASSSPTTASAPEGMSGGAKAGIAIGVLLGLGVLAGLIFFLVRKRKRGDEAEATLQEKGPVSAVPAPASAPPPPMKSSSPSTPPQLSVRPVTQFAPDLSGTGGSNAASAGLLGASAAGVAGAAIASRNLTGNSPPPSPSQSTSSAQNPFSDPVNPFSPTTSVAENVTPAAAPTPAPSQPAGAAVATGDTPTVVVSDESEREVSPSQNSGAAVSGAPSIRVSADVESISSEILTAVSGAAIGIASAGAVAAAVAPSPVPPGPDNVHRVQMDFTPSADDELELRAGALVRMLHEYDDGWALCVRMDRSQQGVAPRSCLSARPVKRRPRPPPGAGPGPAPRGPLPPMGPHGRMPGPPPGDRYYPQGPPGAANSSRPPYPAGPMPPANGFPAVPRPMSPGARSMSPAPRSRPGPNPGPRSMSPGPYGPGGMQRPAMPVSQRQRSNSAGNMARPMASAAPLKSSPLVATQAPGPAPTIHLPALPPSTPTSPTEVYAPGQAI